MAADTRHRSLHSYTLTLVISTLYGVCMCIIHLQILMLMYEVLNLETYLLLTLLLM